MFHLFIFFSRYGTFEQFMSEAAREEAEKQYYNREWKMRAKLRVRTVANCSRENYLYRFKNAPLLLIPKTIGRLRNHTVLKSKDTEAAQNS